MKKINVQGTLISVQLQVGENDYIYLTPLASYRRNGQKRQVLINDSIPQGERLLKLNQIAIQQMRVLEGNRERILLK